ncbi:hypothetical protein QBC46DRAFT_432788, partial [Diplogelasinospora grovesii]
LIANAHEVAGDFKSVLEVQNEILPRSLKRAKTRASICRALVHLDRLDDAVRYCSESPDMHTAAEVITAVRAVKDLPVAVAAWTTLLLNQPQRLAAFQSNLKAALETAKDPAVAVDTYKDLWMRGPTERQSQYLEAVAAALAKIKSHDHPEAYKEEKEETGAARVHHARAVAVWKEMLAHRPDCDQQSARHR